MSGLLPGVRPKGLNPRAQCMPSMGGSCCPLISDKSCRAAPEVSLVCANVTTASSNTRKGTNFFLFMRIRPFEIGVRTYFSPGQEQSLGPRRAANYATLLCQVNKGGSENEVSGKPNGLSRAPRCSEQFSRSEVIDQRQIGFQKVVREQVFPLGPLDVTEDAVFNFAFVFANDVEAKFHHAAVGVFVHDADDFVADGGSDSEFFFQLPPQSVAGLFALFDFSAGKFPFQRHGLMARALAYQHLALFHDQGCNDALHSVGIALACEALTRGSMTTFSVEVRGEAMSKFTAAASYFNVIVSGPISAARI